ncbi:MAG: hypothetical protein IJC48_00350 [Clostridia bacterium]|nr:hypothetical protein [Clostridia bacterium]
MELHTYKRRRGLPVPSLYQRLGDSNARKLFAYANSDTLESYDFAGTAHFGDRLLYERTITATMPEAPEDLPPESSAQSAQKTSTPGGWMFCTAAFTAKYKADSV